MKLLQRATALLLLLLMFVVALPTASVAAFDPFGKLDCTAGAGSAVCSDKGGVTDPISGPNGIIIKIVNLVALAGGIAAVVIIILAGLRMVTSGGGAEDVAGARRALIYTVVGLIILALSRTIVVFILNRI